MNLNDKLRYIQMAGRLRRRLDIGYVAKNGDFSVRSVEPYRIKLSKDGQYILETWDRNVEANRSFRVENITDVKVSAWPFTPKFDVEF